MEPGEQGRTWSAPHSLAELFAAPSRVTPRPIVNAYQRQEINRASLIQLLRGIELTEWTRRGALATVVGLIFGLLLGARAAVTAAVFAAIADTVCTARVHSTVPDRRSLSAAGRRTERQLRRLARYGYRAMHCRALPPNQAQIDHVVIGPTGVYTINSDRWDRRLPVRTLRGDLFLGPFSKLERLREAGWQATRAGQLLSEALGRDISVASALAIYGPAIPWKILNIRGVDVFEGRRVRRWITRRPRRLSDTEIADIAETADRVLPPRYPV